MPAGDGSNFSQLSSYGIGAGPNKTEAPAGASQSQGNNLFGSPFSGGGGDNGNNSGPGVRIGGDHGRGSGNGPGFPGFHGFPYPAGITGMMAGQPPNNGFGSYGSPVALPGAENAPDQNQSTVALQAMYGNPQSQYGLGNYGSSVPSVPGVGQIG